MDTIRPFFFKNRAFFRFSKKGRGGLLPSHIVARLPCLDEAKVSPFNSDITNFVDVRCLHEMCFSLSLAILYLQKRYCCYTFLSFLLGATIPATLTKNQVKAISIHFFRKSFPSLNLSNACPEEKSSHKKNHAYLTDSECFTCLLKKRSCLQYVTEWTFMGF